MSKLLTALIVGMFAAGSAIAADTTTKSTDAMKSADATKYKECMKKDASGKDSMDQACKDKIDKAATSKGTDSMKAPEKGAVPTGSDGKAAPKGK